MRRAPLAALALVALVAAEGARLGAAEAAPVAGAPTSSSGAPGTPAAGSAPPPGLEVLAVTSNRRSHPDSVRLGDRLTVTVSDLPLLLSRVGGDCQNVVLFLDGIALPGTPAESCDVTRNQLRYWLVRSESNDREWHTLLGSPDGFERPVPLSLGTTSEFALPTRVEGFSLVVLPRGGFFAFVALFVVALAFFLRLASRTDMLRSASVVPAPGQRRPYSLARSQMAFWFFLVMAAYVFIWLVTEELDTITESVLGLIGIGSGTALGAAMIDSGRREGPPIERSASGSFFRDVLEGPSGISLHRFQMLAWTAVLGVIFFVSVYYTLSMPEFSPTLLGLMGISSGTFLGFKVPENQPAKAGAAPPEAKPAPPAEPTGGGP